MKQGEHGLALIVVLLAISTISALGMGLALSTSSARLAEGNHGEAVALLNAAESAVQLAVRDLADIEDWTSVLDGTVRSPRADGPPGGLRQVAPGVEIDLTQLTNVLTCGRAAGCSVAQRRATTLERPWGANNPQWRLFFQAPLPAAADRRRGDVAYAVVWLGDDPRETDGDPLQDGGGPEAYGRYWIRARVEVFGRGGARKAIEAELRRICPPGPEGPVCLPGIRVHSWRSTSAAVP